ncbi:MAG TPA: hypothetical protein VF092_13080 [Longimicrobium sp.]
MRTAALILPALLLLAPPARAQERHSYGETQIVSSHDGRQLEVRARGRVEFNDAGDWVESMEPGASLTVREEQGGREQRIEFRSDGDGVEMRYRVNGRERPLDAAGRDWARRTIREATRESGIGADARVARIRRRAGVAGVLADMADLRTDTGRRLYYRALLASGPMSDADFARVMDDAGARIRSNTERRLVLVEAADRVSGGRGLAALLRAAGGMESDTETRLVLTRVAERNALAEPAARDAFFRAVEGIGSGTERRLVLLTALRRGALADAGFRAAFFRAVDGIGSDTERRLVLVSALERASEPTAVAALRSAAEMGSDTEKRLVLTRVPSGLLGSPRVTDAYRAVVGGMRSDTERRLALSFLVNGGR